MLPTHDGNAGVLPVSKSWMSTATRLMRVGISTRAGRGDGQKSSSGYRKIGFLGTVTRHHLLKRFLEGSRPYCLREIDWRRRNTIQRQPRNDGQYSQQEQDLDFLYSNDMIGAGGLLYCPNRHRS
jgi:hypothetical protein